MRAILRDYDAREIGSSNALTHPVSHVFANPPEAVMKRHCIVLAAVLLLTFVASPGAQTTTYLVSGKVSSVSDPLSGATVEAFATGTNLSAGWASTDASGAYGMQLPAGTYDFVVTPTGGSGLNSARSPARAVTRPTTIDFVLVASGGARLSGRVLDVANTGVGGKYVSLSGSLQASTHSAEDGTYTLDVPPGTYTLGFFGAQSREDSVEPAIYSVQTANLVLQDSVTIDFVPPVKRVQVVVKDGAGSLVPGVRIATSGPSTCEFTIAGLPACGNSSYPQDYWRKAETDASGQAVLWLLPTRTGAVGYEAYEITAIPPATSGLATTTIRDIDVTGEKTVQITLESAVVLQGLVTDAANAGVQGKYVILEGALRFSTNSAADGSYALSVPRGVYGLVFHGHRVRPEAAEPMYYLVRTTPGLDLQASRTANLAPPVKAVTVIVRDTAGNRVPDVEITTDGAQTCELTILGLPACGSSSYYSFAGVSQKTDANGQTTLWLFPTQAGATGYNAYRLVATPPPDSPFVLFGVDGIAVTGEKTVIISLPFAHDPPVTEASLTPAPGPGGAYLGPVTITLSATAFGGTTVAQTYYQVDSGPAQTYSAPFQVSGDGIHAVRYWSTDSSGAYETPRTTTFEIVTTIDGLIATLQAASATGGISKSGVVKSFQAKLDAAKSAIARGQSKTAVNTLQAFLSEVEAQRGKAVLEGTYQLLRARTLVVIAGLR